MGTTLTSAQLDQTCAVSSQSSRHESTYLSGGIVSTVTVSTVIVSVVIVRSTHLPGGSSSGTVTRSDTMPSVQSPEHQPSCALESGGKVPVGTVQRQAARRGV